MSKSIPSSGKKPEEGRPAAAPGIVQGPTDTAYSLRALARVTGLGEHGLRQLRALGLPMPYVGRERWVLGSDFVELVKRLRDRPRRGSDCDTDSKGGS